MKRIDPEKLPEIFQNLRIADNNVVFNKMILHQNGKDEAEIYYMPNDREWRFIIDNFPGQRRSFATNFPFRNYEEFRSDMERIGINLRYISDEENE